MTRLPAKVLSNEKRGEIYIAALASGPEHSLNDRLFAGEEIFEFAWIEAYEGMAISLNQSPSGDQIARASRTISSTIARLHHSQHIGGRFTSAQPLLRKSTIAYGITCSSELHRMHTRSYHSTRMAEKNSTRNYSCSPCGACLWALPQIAKPYELAHLIDALAASA
jgi:hypothetical protein